MIVKKILLLSMLLVVPIHSNILRSKPVMIISSIAQTMGGILILANISILAADKQFVVGHQSIDAALNSISFVNPTVLKFVGTFVVAYVAFLSIYNGVNNYIAVSSQTSLANTANKLG